MKLTKMMKFLLQLLGNAFELIERDSHLTDMPIYLSFKHTENLFMYLSQSSDKTIDHIENIDQSFFAKWINHIRSNIEQDQLDLPISSLSTGHDRKQKTEQRRELKSGLSIDEVIDKNEKVAIVISNDFDEIIQMMKVVPLNDTSLKHTVPLFFPSKERDKKNQRKKILIGRV